MAKNRSHGTPEQFEQAVRQRIEELTGDIESATRVDASYIPEKIPGLIIQTIDEAYETDGGDELYDSIDEYAENYYEMPASEIKTLYGLYDGSNEDTGIETTDGNYYIAYSGHGVVQVTRDEMLHHFARDVGLDDDVESNTVIMADTDKSGLFADPNGIIGEPGELYTYEELKQMYESGVDSDQWLASYPTFDAWYQQIILGYLDRVSGGDATYDDNEHDELELWEVLGTKQVQDSDGFWTDYTLWHNIETDQYVCIFGDSDLYNPENTSPDFETASEFEAYEWFNDYDTGELEGEDDIYDEIHSSTNPRRNPILGKDSGMENPSYVSLILDTIPYVLKDGGIADEVTKVGHADGNIVFTFKKDGDTYTARFPEHELTGRDHDDLPDDEWLIEDAARDAIAGINAATNTCGVAAKPVVGAEVLYVDDGGVLGEPGAQYNYDELYNMFIDNWDYDPVMVDYDTFDAWFKDTKPYLRIVKSSSQIKADLSEVPDVTEVVIEGSEDDSSEDVPSDVSSTDIRSKVYNALSDIGFRYHSKGIELTQADFRDAFDFFMLKYFDSDSNE